MFYFIDRERKEFKVKMLNHKCDTPHCVSHRMPWMSRFLTYVYKRNEQTSSVTVNYHRRLSNVVRRVATCKPGKPRLTSFPETLALFFIQFLSFRKIKVQDRQNGPSKLFRAYQKKLAGYAPGSINISNTWLGTKSTELLL